MPSWSGTFTCPPATVGQVANLSYSCRLTSSIRLIECQQKVVKPACWRVAADGLGRLLFKEGGWAMRRISLVMSFLAMSAVVGCAGLGKQETPRICVTGKAEVSVVPDRVRLYTRVVTLDKDIANAKSENDRRTRATLALAEKFGIHPKDVMTDYLSIRPKYEQIVRSATGQALELDDWVAWPKESITKTGKLVGYEMTRNITIALRDLKQFDNLLSAMIESGVNEVRQIEFQTANEDALRAEARQKAVQDAREKAEAIARQLGAKLGRAVLAQERDRHYESDIVATSYPAEAPPKETASATMAPGMITLSSSVDLTFELKR